MKNLYTLTLLVALFWGTPITNAQLFTKRINCGSTAAFTHNGDAFDADTSVASMLTFDGGKTGSFYLTLPDHLKSIRHKKYQQGNVL